MNHMHAKFTSVKPFCKARAGCEGHIMYLYIGILMASGEFATAKHHMPDHMLHFTGLKEEQRA